MHPKVDDASRIKRKDPRRDPTFPADQPGKEVTFELSSRSGWNLRGQKCHQEGSKVNTI